MKRVFAFLLAAILVLCCACSVSDAAYQTQISELKQEVQQLKEQLAQSTQAASISSLNAEASQKPAESEVITPTPASSSSEQVSGLNPADDNQTQTVYITRTGKKYHSAGCQYLSKSCFPISLRDAKAKGYTPCSRCNPPK